LRRSRVTRSDRRSSGGRYGAGGRHRNLIEAVVVRWPDRRRLLLAHALEESDVVGVVVVACAVAPAGPRAEGRPAPRIVLGQRDAGEGRDFAGAGFGPVRKIEFGRWLIVAREPTVGALHRLRCTTIVHQFVVVHGNFQFLVDR